MAAAAFLIVSTMVLALLALPLKAVIGPFYWDTMLYYDAANRIFSGQVPFVDFLAPVGPLEYWLFAAALAVFPAAQGVYAATWSILIVSVPIMAFAVYGAAKRSPLTAFALAMPFLIFSALPFNVEEFYPYPGVDGYGIYNRHTVQLLYALIAVLLFAEGVLSRIAALALCLTALFLSKITGFAVALPLIVLALMAGRLRFREVAGALLLFAVALAALELSQGVIGGYIRSVIELIGMNEHGLVIHALRAVSGHIGTVLAAAGFTAALLLAEWRTDLRLAGDIFSRRALEAMGEISARPWVWVAAGLVAGILIESQNWGGQALILIWPAAILALKDHPPAARLSTGLIWFFAAACLIPNLVNVSGRALRTFAAQVQYADMTSEHLGPIASISMTPAITHRVDLLRDLSIKYPDYSGDYVNAKALPFYTYYAMPEFQLAWLNGIDEVVGAIKRVEAERATRFDTIMSLNFVNPVPYLMNRQAPRMITIGMDPFRTLPQADEKTLAALEDVDLFLWPKCPQTYANARIREIYAEAVAGLDLIALSPCWDGYIRK